jgi:hypothetical protein
LDALTFNLNPFMASPVIDVLDHELRQNSINPAQQSRLICEIINAIWPAVLSATERDLEDIQGIESFFKHYLDQTSRIAKSEPEIESVTHRQFLSVAKLTHNKTLTREGLRDGLRDEYLASSTAPVLSLTQIEILLELGVRIFMHLYVNSSKKWQASGIELIVWAKDHTIKNVMDSTIPSAPNNSVEGCKPIPLRFNARDLHVVAGIQISWTYYLHEHLQMEEKDTKLKVFHLASCLRQAQGSTSETIPSNLATETLHTLALLLPRNDDKVQEWYKQEQTSMLKNNLCQLDSSASQCDLLPGFAGRMEYYKHWGQRLEYLISVYSNHEPQTMKQWVRDKRRPAQRTNFWIAVAAFVLALSSLALTAMQTWASFEQLSKIPYQKFKKIGTAPMFTF